MWLGVAALSLLLAGGPAAPGRGTLIVRVRHGSAPLAGAEVTLEGVASESDAGGTVTRALPEGEYEIAVARPGFLPATIRAAVRAGAETVQVVQLLPVEIPDEVVTVLATRSGRIVDDQPLRVETVPEEEIEENLTIAPGNLSTLLNELAGVEVQTASPTLGGALPRLQGMRGRHTQILSDELPLFGAQPDAFGLLQVPPLDLAHVEVLKGPASAIHGGSALGGIIHLVSRRPPAEPELLLNANSHGGADAVGFVPLSLNSRWGCTLLAGVHHQDRKDVDGDGWTSVPGVRRGEIRPRLFWSDASGRSLFVTVGAMREEREGGTVGKGRTPAGNPFVETSGTRRLDGGLVGRFLVGRDRLVVVRGAVAETSHDLVFDAGPERSVRRYGLLETSISGTDRGHTWVVGAAVERDAYRARDLAGFDFTYSMPAVFLQDEFLATRRLTLSASGRAGRHDVFGTFLDARIAALIRVARGWLVRASVGAGHAAPVPLDERTDVVGLSRVLPFRVSQPERVTGAMLDVGWSGGSLEVNADIFASTVDHPLLLRDYSATPGALEFVSADTPTRTYGGEFLARLTRGALQAIASYTYVRSRGEDATRPGRRDIPLTPRHTAELAAIWEKEAKGRAGVEVSYTGRQRLEDDPYREVSRSYVVINALGEVRIGETGIFVNAINLADVRQTRFDPIVRPDQAPDGRWVTDAWAPLDGRTFNAGVRWEF